MNKGSLGKSKGKGKLGLHGKGTNILLYFLKDGTFLSLTVNIFEYRIFFIFQPEIKRKFYHMLSYKWNIQLPG